ncbi:hypothetical protein ERD95_14280 [Enterobacteriaceae bacterium ML5]|nr:hypothetical protein ERD95_14280 [Enterobacteriaceae bacterium ML5]
MESINKEIQSILNKANAQGSLCSSATANGIMKAVKPFYGDINNANFINQKIEALKSEPGIPFPTNYRELLSQ